MHALWSYICLAYIYRTYRSTRPSINSSSPSRQPILSIGQTMGSASQMNLTLFFVVLFGCFLASAHCMYSNSSFSFWHGIIHMHTAYTHYKRSELCDHSTWVYMSDHQGITGSVWSQCSYEFYALRETVGHNFRRWVCPKNIWLEKWAVLYAYEYV